MTKNQRDNRSKVAIHKLCSKTGEFMLVVQYPLAHFDFWIGDLCPPQKALEPVIFD